MGWDRMGRGGGVTSWFGTGIGKVVVAGCC
jgi:hypothetical protein